MMDQPKSAPNRPEDEAQHLLAGFKTLLMSTVGAEGVPDASYTPFVRMQDDCFYVYVSGLSRHTTNLEATGLVSVLFVEDERDAKQLFARRRLSFDCRVKLIPRNSATWKEVMEHFSRKFGDVIDVIQPLGDFKLFCIAPKSGMYVRGFGQAYRFTGATLENFKHIDSAR
jgi:putative heme iron utilization protein